MKQVTFYMFHELCKLIDFFLQINKLNVLKDSLLIKGGTCFINETSSVLSFQIGSPIKRISSIYIQEVGRIKIEPKTVGYALKINQLIWK